METSLGEERIENGERGRKGAAVRDIYGAK